MLVYKRQQTDLSGINQITGTENLGNTLYLFLFLSLFYPLPRRLFSTHTYILGVLQNLEVLKGVARPKQTTDLDDKYTTSQIIAKVD